jgi:hypothetical protein
MALVASKAKQFLRQPKATLAALRQSVEDVELKDDHHVDAADAGDVVYFDIDDGSEEKSPVPASPADPPADPSFDTYVHLHSFVAYILVSNQFDIMCHQLLHQCQINDAVEEA